MSTPIHALHQWAAMLFVVVLAIAGECLIAAGMRRLGDLYRYRTSPGLRGYLGPVRAVLASRFFLVGAFCMAVNFFAMLYALSIAELSLAAPAIAALTYIGNAIAAKFFLHENVDRRRWLAAIFVCIGVLLLAH